MDLQIWLTYLIAIVAIALAPGPGAVLSMGHGLSYGVRQTVATIVGLQAGLVVILLVAGLGVGALLLASGTAFAVVKVLGAAYLVWLGVQQWRAPVRAASSPEPAARAESAHLSVVQRFMRGLLTNVTNPKGIVFMVAVLPQFIDPARPLWLQLLVLLLTTVAVDMVVMHGYAALAASLRDWMSSMRARRAQNRVAGGVLMAMGAGLALADRLAR